MKRIDTATKSEDLFGAGKHGFRNSNKGAGIAATQVDADWCNHIQEEIANVVEGAGDALDDADRTQLLQAINTLIAAAQINEPTGKVIYMTGNAAPTGYIKANGALLLRASYPDLWAYAQASGNLAATDGAWTAGKYSPGDGATTFRIPDLRAEFIRGWDDSRGVDTGRAFGSSQTDDNKAHSHNLSNGGTSVMTASGSGRTLTGLAAGSSVNGGAAIADSGGTETRPRNLAFLPCIKY